METEQREADQALKWDEISSEVVQAWSNVFRVVNTVVAHHDHYGYGLIERKINPSLHDILRSLKVLEAILDTILVENDLEYEMSRLILNAKQQINLIEMVAAALKYERQDDYEAAIQQLRNQAQF